MAQNIQHVKSKVRAPRVHITYDVETEGAIKMVSLPFTMGVLAELSGDRHQEKDPAKKLKNYDERQYQEISTVNFDEVLKDAAPTLKFAVENKLDPKSNSKLRVDLAFSSMKDFEPEAIANQLDSTRQLLEMRKKMHSLLTRLEGQSEADALLREVIEETKKRAKGQTTNSDSEKPGQE